MEGEVRFNRALYYRHSEKERMYRQVTIVERAGKFQLCVYEGHVLNKQPSTSHSDVRDVGVYNELVGAVTMADKEVQSSLEAGWELYGRIQAVSNSRR